MKKNKDELEILEEEIKKLKKVLREKEKTIKQLKTEVNTIIRTTSAAFQKTEFFLKDVVDGRPLSEILRAVESGAPLSKLGDSCPKCKKSSVNKILFSGFHIISCECGFRAKIDEQKQIAKT